MRMQRLDLNIQRAEIGVNVTNARMNISSPQANISINAQTPELQIDHQGPSFSVDWDRIRRESGIETSGDFANNFRDEGRQAALRAVANYVREGNHFANHRIPAGDRVPTNAARVAMARLQRPEVNIGLMPQSPANLTWDTGGVNINVTRHSLSVDASPRDYMPRMTLDPRQSVSTYLRTQPHISVSVVDMLA